MWRLYAELQSISADLATRSGLPPGANDLATWRRLYAGMTRRRDLEIELADLMIKLGAGSKKDEPDVEKLKAALPPDVALVDFVLASNEIGWKTLGPFGSRLLAFVIRAGSPVVRLDLGPIGPIEGNIDGWRKVAAEDHSDNAGASGSVMTREFASRLANLLWRPLQPHLTGIRSVLVSPDGALCRFPLGVSPRQGGTNLPDRGPGHRDDPDALDARLGRTPAFSQWSVLAGRRHRF